MLGHFKKHNSPAYRYLKEFRLKLYKDINEGEIFDVSMFEENELLKVTGTSKGKGFQGVMRRHNFHGFKSSHGVHESYRGPAGRHRYARKHQNRSASDPSSIQASWAIQDKTPET